MKKQNREKNRILCTMAVAALLALSGCSGKEETVEADAPVKVEKSGENGDGKAEEDKALRQEEPETFVFQDVYENSYEAELLDHVPKCEYDFSKLTERNGYQYYEDPENGVVSRVGIDVSEFQGEVDWNAVRDSGVEFVMVRFGYRGYGENGVLVVDPMFETHVRGASDAGLQVGAYFFSQAVSDDEAREEAAFVLEHIAPYNLTGPMVFDTEEIKYDTARTDNNTREQFTNNCIIFCDEIRNAGYYPMIYANMKWMAFTLDLTRLTEYPFWYADYHAVPQCPYAYEMWQYTETGSVPGINGNADINLWFQHTDE